MTDINTRETKGFTLWFTGPSGSGKSTVSRRVYMELRRRNVKAELLDGDVIRTNFSLGLGFSKQDRDINVRRMGFMSYLLTKNDVVSIVAAISPYEAIRQCNRRLIGRYVEVFCSCPLSCLEARDVKGLYAKARAGEIKNFTGISDPYEEPPNPEIILRTDAESVDESVSNVLCFLERSGYLWEGCEADMVSYSEEDEELRLRHLKSLGYL